MKKLFAAIAAALLLLSCAACGGSSEAAVSDVSISEKAWNFVIQTTTYLDERKTADGAELCTGHYEHPTLILLDDGGNPYSGTGAPPTEAQLAACRVFNERFEEGQYTDSFRDLLESAQAALSFGYAESSLPYTESQNVTSVYQTAGMVSVEYDFYSYTGGAHGYGYRDAVNFDLERGAFFDWTELTDRPDDLRARLGDAVVESIQRDGMDASLFADYEASARALEYARVAFDAEGVSVTFGESVLGPHAAGWPNFHVEYETFDDLLNARGARLLARG